MTLEPDRRKKTLVIGVGNRYRSDDAAGLVAARKLGEKKLPDVTIIEQSGDGTALIEAWEGAETVILIDAVRAGSPPGTLHRVDPHARSVPARLFSCSSHVFGVAQALELARILNRLPPRIVVYGIEGLSFETGEGLSAEAARGVEAAMEAIRREVETDRMKSL